MKNLVTERLVLRNFKESDAQGYLDCYRRPRVNCFMSEKVETIEEARKEVLSRSRLDSCIAMSLKEGEGLIGDLFWEKEEPDTYSVGWQLGSKHEGRGYAFEAASALLGHLFLERGARRVYAYAEEDNNRSRKLCSRLGMRLEGCFEEFISFVDEDDGTPRYENTCQYALLKREWLARR